LVEVGIKQVKIMNREKSKTSVLITLMVIIFCSCNKDDSDSSSTNGKTTAVFNSSLTYNTLIDQDGNVYKTVIIGTQTWMAENLRTTKYNDNTFIPNITSASEWTNLTTGAYNNYKNTTNADTIATYGRLYNWYAVNTGKLAPKGWHVPTEADWSTLTDYLGGEIVAGGKLKETGTTHWSSPNTEATNETGFTALPGGYRWIDGPFYSIGIYCYWWSSTEYSSNLAVRLATVNYSGNVFNTHNYKNLGNSVRCVKD